MREGKSVGLIMNGVCTRSSSAMRNAMSAEVESASCASFAYDWIQPWSSSPMGHALVAVDVPRQGGRAVRVHHDDGKTAARR